MHQTTKYATPETLANEHQVQAFLEELWGVELYERGHYNPIDWDVYKDGEQLAVIELKTYNRTTTQDPTVILNVRKYIALRDWNLESHDDLPAFYMVNFLDEIRYIEIRAVNPSFPVMGGQKGGPRSTDWEPVYKVPVSSMTVLAKKGKPNG